MVFIRKYKPERRESLRLGGRAIAFTSLVNYLGVLLDPKLNLRQHLRARWKKIYSSMWACRRVMALGINPKIAIWMYQTVLPQKLYASVVCWPVVSRVEAKNLLQSLQSTYLRAAVGSTKTPTIETIEVALSLIPLDMAVIRVARFTAYRLNCQREWRNTGLDIYNFSSRNILLH